MLTAYWLYQAGFGHWLQPLPCAKSYCICTKKYYLQNDFMRVFLVPLAPTKTSTQIHEAHAPQAAAPLPTTDSCSTCSKSSFTPTTHRCMKHMPQKEVHSYHPQIHEAHAQKAASLLPPMERRYPRCATSPLPLIRGGGIFTALHTIPYQTINIAKHHFIFSEHFSEKLLIVVMVATLIVVLDYHCIVLPALCLYIFYGDSYFVVH